MLLCMMHSTGTLVVACLQREMIAGIGKLLVAFRDVGTVDNNIVLIPVEHITGTMFENQTLHKYCKINNPASTQGSIIHPRLQLTSQPTKLLWNQQCFSPALGDIRRQDDPAPHGSTATQPHNNILFLSVKRRNKNAIAS
jgi:hypothetical protein